MKNARWFTVTYRHIIDLDTGDAGTTGTRRVLAADHHHARRHLEAKYDGPTGKNCYRVLEISAD
jgi:hypothetical protein